MLKLPIFEVIHEIQSTLIQQDELVLEAPPGAGKTTHVPLALLDAEWLQGMKIVMLEPRRIAARAAAERMAASLGEKVGQTVGYRIRHENKTSSNTKIVVVTEGVLTRWLQQDPSLEGVALVIFDEFHERNLDSDLGLAFCLQARELFRDDVPLKLLIMSATLDGESIRSFMGDAPLIKSEGKSYPVAIEYTTEALDTRRPNISLIGSTIQSAINRHDGNILVFLPGIGEIERVRRELSGKFDHRVAVYPLHGGLKLEEQQRAIAPLKQAGAITRKIVLATDIAETSLTIEGIHTVIDSGLTRKPEFDPRSGMTRLSTKRISLASATQRSGRAGRLGPGTAIRMWQAHDETLFVKHSAAEILNTELSGFALQLFNWGVSSPSELQLIDQPNQGSFNQALSLLQQLGALCKDKSGRHAFTAHGQAMAAIPAHPRLAHMLIRGCEINQSETATTLASILGERDPFKNMGSDLQDRIRQFDLNSTKDAGVQSWVQRIKKQKKQFNQAIRQISIDTTQVDSYDVPGYLIACAYPDRIAKKQNGQTKYKLSNGRQATLKNDDKLQAEEWLVVSDTGGHSQQKIDIIYNAIAFNPHLLDDALNELVDTNHIVRWDTNSDRFNAKQQRVVGKLCIDTKTPKTIKPEEKATAVLNYIKERELDVLTWGKDVTNLCERIAFVRKHSDKSDLENWPNFSKPALIDNIETWLSPYLTKVSKLSDIQKLNLHEILSAQISWDKKKTLDGLAPQFFTVPSGSRIRLDYTQSPPVLAVKLQEMFGCTETPKLFNNRVNISVHLLSPAQRPLQITQDLENFWKSSYHDIKKEMKGRYPKHPWPDDPSNVKATRYTKNRSNRSDSSRT